MQLSNKKLNSKNGWQTGSTTPSQNMPTFPKYPCELPTCLRLNIQHYFLLVYWVFYCPTALKCYLHQVDPSLYRSEGGIDKLFKAFRYPAYRNLYFLTILPTLLSIAILIFIYLFQSLHWPFGDLTRWLIRILCGSSIGVLIGTVIIIFRGFLDGVARGVINGVSICLTCSLVISVLALMGIDTGVAEWRSLFFGYFFGMVVRVVFGTSFGISLGVATCIIGGLISSLFAGLVIVISNAFAVSQEQGLIRALIFGIYQGLNISIPNVVFYYLGVWIGLLSIFTYTISFLLCLVWHHKLRRTYFPKFPHPILWNELYVIPFIFINREIKYFLNHSEVYGFKIIALLTTNPFHYNVLQKSLQEYLYSYSQPIHFLYKLLEHPDLESYAFAPVLKNQWLDIPSVREILLCKLNGSEIKIFNLDLFVYKMIGYRQNLKRETLMEFAGLFYVILQEDKNNFKNFDLCKYADIYVNIANYPGGPEVVTSYTLFANSLKCQTITDIPESQNNLPFALPSTSTAIRPGVITAQKELQAISQNIHSALTMTSRVNQLATYAVADDDLQKLEQYITENTLKPERSILLLIVKRWKEIIISVSGTIARQKISKKIANPYVCGNPVRGDIFVGRDDILNQIEGLWQNAQPPSLVIYGHRRMGKSSILLNLRDKFDKDTVFIDFNMQRVGTFIKSNGQLLHSLAVHLYDALEPEVSADWAEPKLSNFTSGDDISLIFDRFLKELDKRRNGKRFAIAIDEFEIIDRKIEDKILEAGLIGYFRSVIQTYPWILFAFAGLPSLKEMTADYWEPLFGSVDSLLVSFLEPAAARKLITQPTTDFNLDYDTDAIDMIIQATAGQPYLIQLICHTLVSRFNDQISLGDTPPSTRFSTNDVEAAIASKRFEDNSIAYFRGIWGRDDDDRQKDILRFLASKDLSFDELLTKTQFKSEELKQSIDLLKAHDVLRHNDYKYTYYVPLMRSWVAKHQTID
jgi:hypothetical protein